MTLSLRVIYIQLLIWRCYCNVDCVYKEKYIHILILLFLCIIIICPLPPRASGVHCQTTWPYPDFLLYCSINCLIYCSIQQVTLTKPKYPLAFCSAINKGSAHSQIAYLRILKSKPSFLDLITSAQQLSSQRGVKMEVLRDRYLCIHRQFWNNFFRFWSALTRYKCACKKIPKYQNTKIPKYHLLVKWIGGAAVAHSTLVPWHRN